MSNVPLMRARSHKGEAQWRVVVMPNGHPVRKGPVRPTRAQAEQDLKAEQAQVNGIVWIERDDPK